MSTKIFNAYRIHGARDFDSLNNFLDNLATEVDKILYEEFNKTISRDMILTFDQKIVQPLKETKHDAELLKWGYFSHFIDLAEKEKSEASRSSRRGMPYDFDVHIPFFFCSHFVYCIVFTRLTKIHNLIKNLPTVEEYYYFDNADSPDGISEKDWDERERLWTKIMPSGIPSEKGLQFSRTNPTIFPDQKLILGSSPKFEERIQIASERIVRDNNSEKVFGKNGGLDLKLYSKFRKSDEYKKDLKIVMKSVSEKLPKKLEIQTFR